MSGREMRGLEDALCWPVKYSSNGGRAGVQRGEELERPLGIEHHSSGSGSEQEHEGSDSGHIETEESDGNVLLCLRGKLGGRLNAKYNEFSSASQ